MRALGLPISATLPLPRPRFPRTRLMRRAPRLPSLGTRVGASSRLAPRSRSRVASRPRLPSRTALRQIVKTTRVACTRTERRNG